MRINMDLEQNRNTNVPGTIAGFYYQILIACKELCAPDVKSVGVETGADVVVIRNNNRKTLIETKLHTHKFNRCSSDVTKTIYNFYCSYQKEEIEQMYFVSNVDMDSSDKSLFDNWENCDSDTIAYIKKAILKESIQHDKQCKEKYEEYRNTRNTEDKDLFDELWKDIKDNNAYAKYAIINDECSYEEFAKVLKFEFLNKNKCDEVQNVKNCVLNKLKNKYFELESNVQRKQLDNSNAYRILNSLIVKFYDLTVSNSHKKKDETFTTQEFLDVLEDYLHNDCLDEEAFKLGEYLNSLALAEMREMEDLDLSVEEDKCYFECYCQCEKIFVDKLRACNGNIDFVKDYFIYDPNGYTIGDVEETINRLIKMLAAIMYYEKIEIKDIDLCRDKVLNLSIVNRLQSCYKYMAGKDDITQIIRKMAKDWQVFSDIEQGQVIVASASYRKGGEPCGISNLNPEIYDFTQVDENHKDFEFLKRLNYKCATCVNYKHYDKCNFWKGGGGLCKRI